MEKGVCKVPVAAVRVAASHQSEMISQILYGETAQVYERSGAFVRIVMDFDGFEGWVDRQQLGLVSERHDSRLLTEVFSYTDTPDGKMLLSAGSEVAAGDKVTRFQSDFTETASHFLHVPFLWGGRCFFGVDSSGFTQLIYKLHGHTLPREANQQADKGIVLDFIEEAEAGDLAFFEDSDGHISHVGMMLEEQRIIHAYGKVRIDHLDSSGIYNAELRRHTHQLRFVKRMR
ncbi:hydrolase Nlp/P60 [Chryseobacterium sp. 6424]|uniref:C40 family peptidase n=1 Tax=Chryseobacterium sp. 6424 TaxID=2039166 RepID=UPI000EFA3BF3|nr:C40 family peptidase [Chryseobacterium sp. 6424]AYO56945.1 hydrolase Nlp/P60 [Chryseobacterium sp. 6424]